jgi:hypothetical protein
MINKEMPCNAGIGRAGGNLYSVQWNMRAGRMFHS